jgi:hypothetical protein
VFEGLNGLIRSYQSFDGRNENKGVTNIIKPSKVVVRGNLRLSVKEK